MGKPEGVSNVFLTYFDYLFRGPIQTWEFERQKRVVGLTPNPRQIENLLSVMCSTVAWSAPGEWGIRYGIPIVILGVQE